MRILLPYTDIMHKININLTKYVKAKMLNNKVLLLEWNPEHKNENETLYRYIT